MKIEFGWDRFAGVLLVLALHGAALWGLWAQRVIPVPQDVATLFVDFIAPPIPFIAPAAAKVALAPRPQPAVPPQPQPAEPPRQLVAETPADSPAAAAVPPAPTPVVSAPAAATPPAPVGPVSLGTELAVSCPQRSAPGYPLLSRRMHEAGVALLRVELDPQGQVSAASVVTGSGFDRLDAAALAAVKTWRCNPAQRNGQPVRAVALQAFKFSLQGH